MKIIFESEEEKEELTKWYCPSDIGLLEKYTKPCGYNHSECIKCWEQAVQMEVKQETGINI